MFSRLLSNILNHASLFIITSKTTKFKMEELIILNYFPLCKSSMFCFYVLLHHVSVVKSVIVNGLVGANLAS